MTNIKVVQKKHFPNADNWMWDYCKYLGSIEYQGYKFDLGIWIPKGKIERPSYAIVYGNDAGDYISGHIDPTRTEPMYALTYKLAVEQKYI